jgi:hypothetical protein
MTPKQKADHIYETMFQTTPDTLSWGTRHKIAIEASKKAVHEIMWSSPTYPAEDIYASSTSELTKSSLQYWKEVKKELDETND